MKRMGFGKAVTAVCAISTLAACGASGGGVDADMQRQAIFSCAKEAGYDGVVQLSVSWQSGGGTVVNMVPSDTVSPSLAGSINNCAAKKLILATPTNPVGEAQTTVAKGSTGNLPLPAEYPLLEGDAELWPTLTLAQQERAIAFLETGSTIRSSLKAD